MCVCVCVCVVNYIFFSRLHNPLWVCIHSPLAGFSLLFRGCYITHNDAPQSVGLLRTSDQLVAETSTWQHTTITTDKHPCPGGIRTHNLSRRAAADPRLRPRDYWDRRLTILHTRNRKTFQNLRNLLIHILSYVITEHWLTNITASSNVSLNASPNCVLQENMSIILNPASSRHTVYHLGPLQRTVFYHRNQWGTFSFQQFGLENKLSNGRQFPK